MASPIISKTRTIINKAAVVLALTYFMLFGALIFILKPGERSTDITLRGLFVISVINAFAACLWASLKTTAYKNLWRLMAVGMCLWMVGETIFFSYVIKYGIAHAPSPSIADVFVVAYLPIILGVIFSLGKVRPPLDNEKKQFLANVAMTALSVFLLCYVFMFIPQWYANPDMSIAQRMYAIGYPLFDWIVFVSLLLASRRLKGNRLEGWLILLMSAFAFSILAVLIFYLLGNHRNPFTLWAWMGTALLISMSAIDEVSGAFIGVIERERPKIKAHDGTDIAALSQSPFYTLIIPFMATIVIPIVWLESIYAQHGRGTIVLVVISTAIIALSIYRNHLLASDGAILFERALRDSLTGLNNHRYFQEILSINIKSARNNGKPLSLLIIDIDDFSQINDSYGHIFGDKVLSTIGSAILSMIREADEACRLSGDVFGIILPATDKKSARKIAESFKENITETLVDAFPETEITLTIGVSTYPTLAADKDELLQTADGALYWGKIHGKSRVVIYDQRVVKVLNAEERAKKVEEVALTDMVRSLAKAVDARDQYTRLHSKRVSVLAKRLAEQIGLDEKTVSRIEVSGILHDVGKIGIPDHILNKPGRLTEEEMVTVKSHPSFSVQIIKSTSLKEIIPAIQSHHERWDGAGYPNGLKGQEIPLEARILAIADTFDAMTSSRPYRKALPVRAALSEIKRCAGSQFDPYLAEQFLAMFDAEDIDEDSAETGTMQSNKESSKAQIKL